MDSPVKSLVSSSAVSNAVVNSQNVTSASTSDSNAITSANDNSDNSTCTNITNNAMSSEGADNGSSNVKCTTTSTGSSSNRPLRLRRVNHSEEIVSGFGKLLKSGAMTDVTLSCQNGLGIQAHRVILSAFSPYFREIFDSPQFTQMPWKYPVLIMRDYAFYEVKAIIEFIYKGEVSVPREKLASVLATARALQVSGLADLKADTFGINTTSNGNLDPGVSPHVNGLQQQQGSNIGLSGGSLTLGGGGTKRSAVSSSSSPSDPDVSSDFTSSFIAKRMRDANETNSSAQSSSLLDAFNGDNTMALAAANLNGFSLDSIKQLFTSLPNGRLPNSVVGQLIQQQLRQQVQLQKMANMRPTHSSLQNNSMQNIIEQQEQLKSHRYDSRNSLTQKQMAIQANIKRQLLKQQLLQSAKNSTGADFIRNSNAGSTSNNPFLELQQRVLQQMQERDSIRKNTSNLKHSRDTTNNGDEEEIDVVADEGEIVNDKSVNEKGIDQESINENRDYDGDDSSNANKTIDNNDTQQMTHKSNHDGDDMDADDEEYEIDMDKDSIFQQQQQLRLQQIQKQQQQFMRQLQIDQEERTLDYTQSISGATNTDDTDADDTGSGFGFDWQEGFTNDLPYNRDSDSTAAIIKNHFQPANSSSRSSPVGQSDNKSNRSTPTITPDFMQPRGPGRPRKGNKSQEISPCPECNKVFVRPDVLKLHYRSVHLNERHPCNMCPKIFKWPGDLSKHKRTKHPEKYPPANSQHNVN